MLGSGWLAEVEMLLNSYSPELKPMQSIGYREVVQYLQNKLKWDAMVEEIQKRTRQFAKRQLTWFRREQRLNGISLLNRTESWRTSKFTLKIRCFLQENNTLNLGKYQ